MNERIDRDMDTPREPERPDPRLDSTEEETVASLLRLAGPRAAAPFDRYERVRLAVHSHWRQTLHAYRPRRVTFWIAGSLAAAAALLLVVGLGLRREAASSPAGPQRDVRVERVSGAVQSLRPGGVNRGDLKLATS